MFHETDEHDIKLKLRKFPFERWVNGIVQGYSSGKIIAGHHTAHMIIHHQMLDMWN
jgi:hypothetical protein